DQVLSAAASATLATRTTVVKAKLNSIIEDLQKRTGVYTELPPSESGLSILQTLSEIISRAEKNERVGRFMIVSVDLQVSAATRSGGRLRFEVAYRGANYIEQNAAFNAIVQDFTIAKNTGAPFENALYKDEERFQSALDPGGQFLYEANLVTDIPILQKEAAAR
ncbi:MAG TPA: hypothetical protein PKE00_00380, partial [Planctomycetota bacterium]|nr:hypothetical protein [Planctomycetota bacterium]